MKNVLVEYLKKPEDEIVDCGPYEYDETDDYPDYVASVASQVFQSPNDSLGIVIGGSGQGEAIMANRFPNVRAVVFNGQYVPPDGRKVPNEIVFAKEHNNANVLSLGAWFLTDDEAKNAVTLWLDTPFSGDERHARRIKKIESLAPKFSTDSGTSEV